MKLWIIHFFDLKKKNVNGFLSPGKQIIYAAIVIQSSA